MITKIFYRNGYINVKPENSPKDSRQLDSFLIYNNAPKCFGKFQGGWYKITKAGTLIFISRTINLPFERWLEIALSEKPQFNINL